MDRLKQRKLHWFSNKITLVCTFVILLTLCSGCKKNLATTKDIYLANNDYDFGIIPDSINKVQHDFYIINNSDDTCRILNIEKSCGCTNITIKRKQIRPHDSLTFNVVLDVGSNYSFIEKEVYIYTNRYEEPLTLYLRATRKVPKVLIKKEFPFKLSKDLRLSAYSALIGYVEHGKEKSFSMNILNSSNEIRHLSLKSKLPPNIDVIFPSKLLPQEISRIVFSCKVKEKIWGEISNDCIFEDENGETAPLKVYYIATENFGKNRNKNPKICIPTTAYSAKVLNSKKDITFDIVNIGNDTLQIRHIQCSDKNFRVCSKKKYCLKGDTCKIQLENIHSIKSINKDVIIGVVTNDRTEPYRQLRIIKD